ncbi:MAG: hypothetical protein PHV99_03190 [Candidatus Pacebacteria bacterium]|nr:hypothetical protein [Candidatus Paceibacterota bacterium]
MKKIFCFVCDESIFQSMGVAFILVILVADTVLMSFLSLAAEERYDEYYIQFASPLFGFFSAVLAIVAASIVGVGRSLTVLYERTRDK